MRGKICWAAALACAGWVGAAEPGGMAADSAALVKETERVSAALAGQGLQIDPVRAASNLAECLVRAADPGAQVLSTGEVAQMQRRVDGWRDRYGVTLRFTNGLVHVAGVDADSPARKAGLATGAVVRTVNQREAARMKMAEILNLLADDGRATLPLTVQNAKGEEKEYTLERFPVRPPPVEDAEVLPDDLGYIKVNHLRDDAGPRVARVLQAWASNHVRYLVLDLRGARGTDWEPVKKIASCFIGKGQPLFEVKPSAGQASAYYGLDEKLGLFAVILVDGKTAGTAEALAAVIKNLAPDALLLGSPTAGDYGLRRFIPLPDGRMAYVADMRMSIGGAKKEYAGGQPLQPEILFSAEASAGDEYEPEEMLREMSLEEKIDKKLRDRVRFDPPLQRAADILQGIRAVKSRQMENAASPAN